MFNHMKCLVVWVLDLSRETVLVLGNIFIVSENSIH